MTSPAQFIAVGYDGLRITSPDGKTWSEEVLGKEGMTFNALAIGGGRCLTAGIHGGRNIFSVTDDGQNWQDSDSDAGYSRYSRGVFFARDRFYILAGDPVTVGNAKVEIFTTKDGSKIESHAQQEKALSVLRRCAVGEDLFVAVGDRGRRAWSEDAITWHDDENSKPLETLIDIAYGNGVFVGVGLHGLRMTSDDGKTWGSQLVGEEGEHLNRILWTGDRFVAVGLGATYFSPDGHNWTREPNIDPPLTAAFGNGVFVGSNWKGRLMSSSDAIRWEQVHRCSQHVEAVEFGELSGTAAG